MDEIIALQADVIALKSSIQTINQGIVLDQAFRQRIQGCLDQVLTMDETMENVRHRVNLKPLPGGSHRINRKNSDAVAVIKSFSYQARIKLEDTIQMFDGPYPKLFSVKKMTEKALSALNKFQKGLAKIRGGEVYSASSEDDSDDAD